MKRVGIPETRLGIVVVRTVALRDCGVSCGRCVSRVIVNGGKEAPAQDGRQVGFCRRRHLIGFSRQRGRDFAHYVIQLGNVALEGVMPGFRRGDHQRRLVALGHRFAQRADAQAGLGAAILRIADHHPRHPLHQFVNQYQRRPVAEKIGKVGPAGIGQAVVVVANSLQRRRAAGVVGNHAGQRFGAVAGSVQFHPVDNIGVLAVETDHGHAIHSQIRADQVVRVVATDLGMLGHGGHGNLGVRLPAAIYGAETVDAGLAAGLAVLEAAEGHAARPGYGVGGIGGLEKLQRALRRGDFFAQGGIQIGGVAVRAGNAVAGRTGNEDGFQCHRVWSPVSFAAVASVARSGSAGWRRRPVSPVVIWRRCPLFWDGGIVAKRYTWGQPIPCCCRTSLTRRWHLMTGRIRRRA